MRSKAAILLLVSLFAIPLHAEDGILKEKSMTTAVLLGIDPIPGDSLYYAGKTTQGTINLLVGAGSGFLFYSALANTLNDCDSSSDESDQILCDISVLVTVAAGVPYLGMLFWDLFGGMSGVTEHNKKVEEQKSSLLDRIQPQIAVTDQGAFVGAKFSF